MTRSADSTFR